VNYVKHTLGEMVSKLHKITSYLIAQMAEE